jgi:HEAT repeat protein
LVEDQDPTVRAAAALALGETWSEDAVEPLTQVFLEDPDPVVREHAARALREIGSEEALNSLKGH